MRSAKDAQFWSKVDIAQQRRFGGKNVWRSICDMQRACRGLIPQRIIKGEKDNLAPRSVDAKQQHWK